MKVVVVGPGEAGKSTLVGLLGDSAINLEHHGRTIAMDHLMLQRDGATVSVVGVPGQPRFTPVREALIDKACAAVWVHPAGDTPDPPTIELLSTLIYGVPYLLVINQRSNESAVPFAPPANLTAPREIIETNLKHQPEIRHRIEAAIWNLVQQ